MYPEQQTAEERAEIARLIDVISAAFRDVRIEDGTTIHEADLEGAYSDDSVRIEAREKDSELDWTEVPDWKIKQFSTSIFFLDPRGWRFYIPAYMIWTLKDWRIRSSNTASAVLFHLDPVNNVVSRAQFSMLSQSQAFSIYDFCRFTCDYSADGTVNPAMQAYWHQIASNCS